jgi:hypothetical protein
MRLRNKYNRIESCTYVLLAWLVWNMELHVYVFTYLNNSPTPVQQVTYGGRRCKIILLHVVLHIWL